MADVSEVPSLESEEPKRMKSTGEEDQDFISSLPDCLIQHILSFLPSTRDSIRTGVLSKRWRHQWARVPILILNPNLGTPSENFSDFIDKTLAAFDCPKIQKFAIDSKDYSLVDLACKLAEWVSYAVARDAKELNLDHYVDSFLGCVNYDLPQLLFSYASLLKFRAYNCTFMPEGNVNWASLKALHIGYSKLIDQAVENVLSGCPVLEYLKLLDCDGFEELVIVSESLKTLLISESGNCSAMVISCPNLEKLEIEGDISCPFLELKDLPHSARVTLDFDSEIYGYFNDEADYIMLKEILVQVLHVKELTIGSWISTVLSLAVVRGESFPLLQTECLTLIDPFGYERQPGLGFMLLCFPLIEKLVIHLSLGDGLQLNGFVEAKEELWELNWCTFDYLMARVKTVEIEGVYYFSNSIGLVRFITFMLEKAKVLEKIVLLENPGQEIDFAPICENLSDVQKLSRDAVVEVLTVPMARIHFPTDDDWDKIVY